MISTISIIGCGNIGEQILKNFSEEKAEFDMNITRRTKTKGLQLAEKYHAKYFSDNSKAIKNAEIIWLCIRPNDFPKVLREIKSSITKNQIIISVAIAISQKYLKKFFPDNIIIRYMPSPLITEKKGIALIVEDRKKLSDKYKKIISNWSSELYNIKDEEMNLYISIASCGSAFIANLLVNTVSILSEKKKEQEKYKRILSIMGIDTLSFLKTKSILECEELVRFAATPGGITAEGLKVLNSDIAKEIIKNTLFEPTKKSKKIQRSYEK